MNPDSPVANTPYLTSLVRVEHVPVADEQFVVTPLPSVSAAASGKAVSALLLSKKKEWWNYGQFETSFRITIRVVE